MKAIRVRIENGRITGDAPPGLPDGELDLVLADAEDDMPDAELARLNDALESGARRDRGSSPPAGATVTSQRAVPGFCGWRAGTTPASLRSRRQARQPHRHGRIAKLANVL